MNLLKLLQNEEFNIFFSIMVGIGLICILRPKCSGSDCDLNKPPSEKDFDQHVYRMGTGTCYEFKTEVVSCPSSGAVEAFRQCPFSKGESGDQFSRRPTSIPCRD